MVELLSSSLKRLWPPKFGVLTLLEALLKKLFKMAKRCSQTTMAAVTDYWLRIARWLYERAASIFAS